MTELQRKICLYISLCNCYHVYLALTHVDDEKVKKNTIFRFTHVIFALNHANFPCIARIQ